MRPEEALDSRPQTVEGGVSSEPSSAPVRLPSTSRAAARVALRIGVMIGTVALLAGLNELLARLVGAGRISGYVLQIVLNVGIAITMAVSLNLINGIAGQFSLGHAGFMSLGAFSSAWLTLHLGARLSAAAPALGPDTPAGGLLLLGVAMLAAGVVAAAAGVVVGLPSLRLRGDYLAIVTLGFGEIIRVVLLNVPAVGGPQGLHGIPPLTNFFWVAMAAVGIIVLSRNLVQSTHGLTFLSVREDEVAAAAMGVNTTRLKVLAFVIGAFFAGIGGALHAHLLQAIEPPDFDFMKSVEFVVMVVLGGTGSITGTTLAAIVLTVLPEILRPIQEYRLIMYSLLLIIMMLTRPQGIFGAREISLQGLFPRRLKGEPVEPGVR
jgi:branched-chain amino acid transport system permease protein